MKKILGSIKKTKSNNGEVRESRSNGFRNSVVPPSGNGPDAIVYREVEAFCESGAPNSQSAGDEYLHLPAIVDGAESSPTAATQAAVRIRTYLSKDHYDRGYAQYNAIMLLRILTDNPGRPFTQNFDKEFISTVKKLLRDGKDSSVQQILRETLDYFETKSTENDSLVPLMDMWRKEKGSTARIVVGPIRSGYNRGPPPTPARPAGLPPPAELAGRIEEARTTARLLVQTVQSTPINELQSNDLVKEFAERVRVASRSIQSFMNAENPHPDDETMLTLIETSEQLSVAANKHQRAVLDARRAMGGATPSPQPQENRTGYMMPGENVYGQSASSQPPRSVQPLRPEQRSMLSPPVPNGYGRSSPRNEDFVPPSGPPPGRQTNNMVSDQQVPRQNQKNNGFATDYEVPENPFADTATYEQPQQQQQPQNYSLFGRQQNQPSRGYGQTNVYGQPAADNPYSQDPQPQTQPKTSPVQRPGAYEQGFTSTPSYIHRQDSAAAHITMHGASPPSQPQQ